MDSKINDELIEPKADSLTYDSYLKISELLTLQSPLSDPEEHDETLFIIIHQVYELWFKQILHEVRQCMLALRQDHVMPFMTSMQRVITIQSVLTNQVDILETMTPTDFNRFRDRLNPASGFQSVQFRILEFMLGMKHREYLKFHKTHAQNYAQLEQALASPTLYDEFLRFLHRQGHAIPSAILERDVTMPYTAHPEVTSALLKIYENPSDNFDLYAALETLMDFDQKLLLWRYRHVAMVERMIGNNRGTGGSSGVRYLSATLAKRCFPEIWQLRDDLAAKGNPYGRK